MCVYVVEVSFAEPLTYLVKSNKILPLIFVGYSFDVGGEDYKKRNRIVCVCLCV